LEGEQDKLRKRNHSHEEREVGAVKAEGPVEQFPDAEWAECRGHEVRLAAIGINSRGY
jgi:hypothetical protein